MQAELLLRNLLWLLVEPVPPSGAEVDVAGPGWTWLVQVGRGWSSWTSGSHLMVSRPPCCPSEQDAVASALVSFIRLVLVRFLCSCDQGIHQKQQVPQTMML